MLNKEEIENKRETNKIGLQMFVEHLNDNSFEDSISSEFTQLRNQLDQEITDFIKAQEEEDNLDYYLDTKFLEDKLLALVEMKIVYLFKNFEINVKKLLSASYQVKTRSFYKWDNLIGFLRDKNFKLNEIDNYQDINQLKNVNNSIKHSSNKISDDLKSIKEFNEIKRLRHYELEDFYERVKFSPFIFLQSLSDKIYEDLYEFNDLRLEKIAEMFALRMDDEIAIKFIEKLKDKY